MVILTSRFTLLATLSSIAAISLLPTPSDAAAIQVRYQDELSQPIAARHSSSHGKSGKKADSRKHADSSTSDMKASSSKMVASTKNAADTPQRHAKPVVPLPARMAQKSVKKVSSSKKAGGSDGGHSGTKEAKHSESRRAVWTPTDPVSRMERFLMGRQDGPAGGMSTQLDRRHHHDHDHHDHEKVIVEGDHDHVDVHRRSVDRGGVSKTARDDHDRILVEGHNDHVHIHDEDKHDDHDRVVVKGDDDHVHFHRSPSPHHHNDHHDEVVVKGDHDSVHFHRSPAPAPHHHHDHHDHDTVIVKGHNEHIKVHRRSPAPHHRHHTVIVKGDNQHVHVGRSPAPVSEPHRHDRHHADKVVVKGDHDHVNVHSRSYGEQPIVISGNEGHEYHVHPASQVAGELVNGVLDMETNLHLRRDDGPMNGVPGSIDIMSQVANSDVAQRIASLVLAAPSNGTAGNTSTTSTFVLNASDTNSTQLYLVPTPASDVDVLSDDPASSSPTSPTPFIKVALQMAVFDRVHAQLRSYCTTFDPRPAAPAPMTVEECTNGSSTDEHKSQVFAYEPGTGVIRPMWYEGEDDGGEDDSDDSTVPTDDPSDGDGSDDDLGGTNNSTTVDPTTPTSSKVVNVTSLQQEALDEQYGDATRPPTRIASVKTFAADVSPGARNVTLVFSPASPEVLPPISQGKMAVPASSSNLATSSAESDSGTATSSATSDTTTAVTATSSVGALEVTGTMPSSGISSDVVYTMAPSGASSTVTESTTSASATASSAFEVKVYNPYAEDSDSISPSAMTSFSSASTSAASATMTPVSTAPYEWMFKQGSLPDLD